MAMSRLVVVACLLAVGAAGWVGGLRAPSRADQLVLARAPLPTSTTTTSTSTTTTTTTTTTLAPAPARATRPIDVPDDPYAPEPIRKIGSIEIPKLGLLHDLYEGITLRNIDNGPSHWPGTAMPGELGNSVVAGHRVTHSRPFRNIDQLVSGDLVIFTVGADRSTYRVTGSQIVTPRDTWIANPTSTATATLFACHPPGSAAYRYVVRLELVSRG